MGDIAITVAGSAPANLQAIGTLAGVRIVTAYGVNGPGVGWLQVTAANLLSWRAPNSATYGTAVDVTAGGSFTITDGDDARKALDVSVTADYLPGIATSAAVVLRALYGAGISYLDVSRLQAANGNTREYAIALTKATAGSVAVKVWIVARLNRYQLKVSGGSYASCYSEDTALALTLEYGTPAALVAKRTIVAGAPVSPREPVTLVVQTASERYEVWGDYRVYGFAGYRFYKREDQLPEEGVTVEWDEYATLPYTTDEVLGDGAWFLAVARFNGVLESGFAHVVRMRIDGGEETDWPPVPPMRLTLTQSAGGVVRVSALFVSDSDFDAPTHFAIWFDTAEPPDFTGTPDYSEAVVGSRRAICYKDLPAQAHDTVVGVHVKMQRGTGASAVYSLTGLTESITVDANAPADVSALDLYPGRLPEVTEV